MALLELNSVSYQAEERLILDQITLSVEQGTFLTITGPSGGGKSTLLRMIASLLSPSSGEILFRGKNQHSYDYTEFRQQVSYCFQQPSLFGETVQDNLEFPYLIRQTTPNQEQMLEHLQMVDLPKSYLPKKINELSGGERQRVALIRNILFLPEILLLDEVTSGLDEQTKTIIHRLIDSIHQNGCTILQVTHDESEIKAAKKLLFVQGGKLK
ncbi:MULTISPECIES: ABC transporter ATP-binding protein [Enterococcus]|uniref:ATP-binding cassette domain-containing protein n=1 Tax=Candidatus Enterococcus murrayae TaxID=2815321 RepID=A0ABS3HNR2_9ENTE|nr:ATP-binding cassette domain-containing protein [Enterococcus sp. MJM16]MBO0454973.1 ATP-binding cassette domain-containing protein [Enterococcus sp. MJM16]